MPKFLLTYTEEVKITFTHQIEADSFGQALSIWGATELPSNKCKELPPVNSDIQLRSIEMLSDHGDEGTQKG